MRISISRHMLRSAGAAGLLAAASLVLTSPPAAAEGYMSATPPANGTPPHVQTAQRTGELDARLARRSAEPRELSGWSRAVFFQGRDPQDREAVKRLGTHPGAAGM
ncbi:MAG: hypothetical protein GWN84_02295 [Gammaproteobacteria bacterium]|nr:hypothetical protein [Gammaproteobacteria bacterium]NIR81978.1 hypothetical protein [Gammaproteobacteria bacterium]NIR89030.1 hypothetical protein [Gammaproteobacteria bacterium]NIU03085.1 hypothetical protein [Gammaproteobacteria bacterium]NIV50609.1 hypothetical protein [Gammaproteobacteria bacterium]